MSAAISAQLVQPRHQPGTAPSIGFDAKALVRDATLAPSSHNTQPWRFHVTGDAIDLIADRTRALPVNDPDDRELTISCGAALFNLRVAAAHAGLTCNVQLLPGDDTDRLARVTLRRALEPLPSETSLHAALSNRRTYRKRFADTPVDAGTIGRLREAARVEGAQFRTIDDEAQRLAVAGLVSEGDAAQWANASWRRELAAWMHPRRCGDGLAMPALAVPIAQLVVRTFDMGGGEGARDRALAEGSPLLALIETPHDTARDWLVAGQALERVLLTACAAGLQASYLNQPIQVPSLRPRLRDLVRSDGVPQLLLRLGYPDGTVPASARRPIDEIVNGISA